MHTSPANLVSPKMLFTSMVSKAGAAENPRGNLKLFWKTITSLTKFARLSLVLFIFGSLKNFPLAWHFRLSSAILSHLHTWRSPVPAHLRPSTLFLPVITSSHSPLFECDFNLHKSNSTYFTDLDIARAHLICCQFKDGLRMLRRNEREMLVLDGEGNPVKQGCRVMLGSVMCSFKKEIGIYERYDMWTRLLCWDRKWLYVVTHFVKKGTVRPTVYVSESWSWFGEKKSHPVENKEIHDGKGLGVEKHILATAICKCVVKLGSLTVHPEVLLQASGLLPPKPGGWATMSHCSKIFVTNGGNGIATDVSAANGNGHAKGPKKIDEWDWERIEALNRRGLEYAKLFAGLDGLHQEYSGSIGLALGSYSTSLFNF